MKLELHIHLHHDGDDASLVEIDRKLDHIITQGDKLMKANAEVLAFLDSLNTYTNEIAADIDEMIADAELDATTKARMQAHSDTLRAIAAKNDNPLPPPVEPPVEPPVDPPVE